MFLLVIQLIFALLVLGVFLWALNAIPWIDPQIKQAIKILIVVIVALWVIWVLYGMVAGGVPAGAFLFPRR